MSRFESGFPGEQDPERHVHRALSSPLVQQAYFMLLGSRSFQEDAEAGNINVANDLEHRNALIAADPRVKETLTELQLAHDQAIAALSRLSESLEQVADTQNVVANDIERRMQQARQSADQLTPESLTESHEG